MDLIENGPLQKANIQFSDTTDKWQISKTVLIGILLMTIAAGAVSYMLWENYCKGKFQLYSSNKNF
jgi:hypothetical protein